MFHYLCNARGRKKAMQEFLQIVPVVLKWNTECICQFILYWDITSPKMPRGHGVIILSVNFVCSSSPSFKIIHESFTRTLYTYMITLNPAVRSCLPMPIVNLWWKLWLSLKFARHFIFWWSGQSYITWIILKTSEWNSCLSFKSSQQLYPACTALVGVNEIFKVKTWTQMVRSCQLEEGGEDCSHSFF